MEHVVLFPHLGSASVATRAKMDQLVVDNLLAWAAGKPPLSGLELGIWALGFPRLAALPAGASAP